MSDKTLGIRITATENASKAFRTIGESAVKTANELRRAGDEGGKGLDKIEQEANQAAPAVEKVGESAKRAGVDLQAMGVALTAIGAGLSYAGQLAMEHERVVIGLQKAYGDAADDMIAFADTLAAETGNLFNDDDILAGERFFATLVNQYDLTIQQVQDLMRTTADLAAGAGIGFEDASNRITAAIRGEAEAAEYLGLTMNQQSIDRQNLTLTMTNQEAAQFRLNALHEQAAWSVGTAASVARSSAGDWASLTNRLKDGAQAAGDFIGPYGSMVAGLGSGAVGLAQFAGGFTALSTGIRTATTASMAFVASPIGLTVTALAGGLALATGAFLSHKQAAADAAAEWERAEQASRDLTLQIQQMTLAGNALEGNWARNFSQTIADEIEWANNELEYLINNTDIRADNWLNNMVISMMEDQGRNTASDAAVAEFRQKLVQDLAFTPSEQAQMSQQMSDLFELMLNPNVDANRLREQMMAIFDMRALDQGRGPDWILAELERLEQQTIALSEAQQLAADGATNVAMSNWDYIDSVNGANVALAEQVDNTEKLAEAEKLRAEDRQKAQEHEEGYWNDLNEWTRQEDEAARQRAERRREEAEALEKITQMEGRLGHERVSALNDAKDAYLDLLDAQLESNAALVTSLMGLDDPLTQLNATTHATEFSNLAAEIIGAGEALDTVFRVIVGNTNQIKSQADQTLSWAEALINVRGELGRIDELVEKGLITGLSGVFDDDSQYAAAQNAFDSIAISTEQINDNIDAIQAIQSPFIAQAQEDLAAYTAELLAMEPAQQRVALGWMDSATAAKAMEINTLAAAVANGELGASGEKAFQGYIEGAVAADPILKALLIDMGLISEGADGTITINFAGAEGAMSEIEQLTSTIATLIDLLDDGEINGSFLLTVEDNATPVIEQVMVDLSNADGSQAQVWALGDGTNATGMINEVTGELITLDGDSATVHVNASDNASGTLGHVQSLLNGLDGRVANTYVNTTYTGRPVGPSASALGGIPGHAQGGIPVELAEWGRERLHFANGGMLDVMQRGIYNVPPNTYVSPNNAVNNSTYGGLTLNVAVNGNVYGVDDLAAEIMAPVADMLRDEVSRTKTAAGVM